MNGKQLVSRLIIAFVVEMAGFALIAYSADFWIATGALLIMWGNNISHACRHELEKTHIGG